MLALWQYLALAAIPTVSAFPFGASQKKAFDWDSTKYLITFGDSYTYVQGTHGHQNYSFIGDLQNFEYDAQTLLTDKIVQNQTATAEGGPNWVEYLTGCGVEEGTISPFDCKRQLWDFAFAGADISVAYTPLHHNYTVSLVNQIAQFTTYGQPILAPHISKPETLVAIWIGINDIGDSAKYAVDFPTFYNNLQSTLFSSVQKIYDQGYRSYLFVNLPPLDRTPGNQARSQPLPNATQVAWYNEALAQHAAAFERTHRDTAVHVFDAHGVLTAILDDPAAYGIVNTTSFCAGYDQPDIAYNYQAYGCPTPLEEYFWFNSGHLTSHVHKILAGALEERLREWSR
ncbi:SGNH/GDSL hydrolase family protein [Aspergillus homomorphus CBS 101889]|uniref:Lysophospholipase A n=1 Tax=Aspergillus homomorphus (strain CBS 101889) TaxID=1450537 RepID=A0A395HUK5_ASPHC|nr:lysophospholipase A [Aspergillus homomorphus CBS 101889]RAL11601.1 lysophospholipase A [Aspergillus homomorphus CBS 101889]